MHYALGEWVKASIMAAMDWEHFWRQFPARHARTDFCRQVGKTVNGAPVGDDQVSLIVRQIEECLAIRPCDVVLDLCCGNGLVTKEVAPRCRGIVGIDFSPPLIEVARTHHQAPNASYCVGSALELTAELLDTGHEKFDRIYMHEALQYFTPDELAQALERLGPLSKDDRRIFFGGVPDKARIWNFYNTPERREEYLRRAKEGNEAIGTWWDRDVMASVAREAGYDCRFIECRKELFFSHYRFDALLTPR